MTSTKPSFLALSDSIINSDDISHYLQSNTQSHAMKFRLFDKNIVQLRCIGSGHETGESSNNSALDLVDWN